MTLPSKIQIALLAAAGLLAGWGFRQHLNLGRELASVEAQVRTRQQDLDSRRPALDAVEQRNRELQEAEKRAGNQTLLSLLRERNAAAMAASQPPSQTHALGRALAKALESPAHRQANEDYRRAEMRASLFQFFKLLNLSPEKSEQYIDLGIEKERRDADRLSALLHGTMTAADALRQQAADESEHGQRCREVLGDDGMAFLDGIADGMRNDEAKRLLGIVQQNMGGNPLSQEQSDRLQGLLKTHIVTANMDDVQLFRPPDEWAQDYVGRQQNVLSAAADFLAPAQLEAVRLIGAADLAERQRQMTDRRTALGIK
jgi:hypothetical protein